MIRISFNYGQRKYTKKQSYDITRGGAIQHLLSKTQPKNWGFDGPEGLGS